MGICQSNQNEDGLLPEQLAHKKAATKRSKVIDDAIVADKQLKVNKVLLLGAGDSGKSTSFKQMILIHGKGFGTPDGRKMYKSIIHNNVINGIKLLCNEVANYATVSSSNVERMKMIKNLTEAALVNKQVADAIAKLWADPGIQTTYMNRSKFPLEDCVKYFFGRLDDISQDNYSPSDQDILNSRATTIGIVEQKFCIDVNIFHFFDVGGQRSERRKWIHCFEKVNAVLFIASISGFDQVLFEDDTVNRMVEALDLAREIFNSEWFEHTALILFLNKFDLFKEKLSQGVQVSDHFDDYPGDNKDILGNNEPEDVGKFIEYKFTNCCEDNDRQDEIYTHFTCATDTDQMRFVFQAVKNSIIKAGLAKAGLM